MTYKANWATGDILLAADQNALAVQQVSRFADATARDAAITSPSEGQACWLSDTNEFQIYGGAAWVPLLDVDTISVSSGNYTISTDLTVSGNVTIQSLNMDTLVAGDVLYASGADTLARLAKGSDDEVLTLASGIPSWAVGTTPSEILGHQVDTSAGNYSTTSTSMTDVDTTNARVAITTPAGCTAVAVLLAAYGGNTGGSTTWQANTTAGTNYDIRLQDSSYWTIGGMTALTLITGLTASTAYNIDWQFKCNAGTTNIYGDSVRPRMVVIAL